MNACLKCSVLVGRFAVPVVDDRGSSKATDLGSCVAPVSGRWIRYCVPVRLDSAIAQVPLTLAAATIKSIPKIVYTGRVY